MGFKDDFRVIVENGVNLYGSLTALARMAGVDQATMSRYWNKGQGLGWENVAKLADTIGAHIAPPLADTETTRDVVWVEPRRAESGRDMPLPKSEDYMAVPLVGEAGAGPGYIPQIEVRSWVLVFRHHASVRFRSNLLAVELGKDADSMVPTLHPGDIVLVDRKDTSPESARQIFLVREPGQEGGAKIKRVHIKAANGRTQIIYYSDNAAENPPEIFDLESDFSGEIKRAIIGRVVWAWSDMTRK